MSTVIEPIIEPASQRRFLPQLQAADDSVFQPVREPSTGRGEGLPVVDQEDLVRYWRHRFDFSLAVFRLDTLEPGCGAGKYALEFSPDSVEGDQHLGPIGVLQNQSCPGPIDTQVRKIVQRPGSLDNLTAIVMASFTTISWITLFCVGYPLSNHLASALSGSASSSMESYQLDSQPFSGRPVKTIRLRG